MKDLMLFDSARDLNWETDRRTLKLFWCIRYGCVQQVKLLSFSPWGAKIYGRKSNDQKGWHTQYLIGSRRNRFDILVILIIYRWRICRGKRGLLKKDSSDTMQAAFDCEKQAIWLQMIVTLVTEKWTYTNSEGKVCIQFWEEVCRRILCWSSWNIHAGFIGRPGRWHISGCHRRNGCWGYCWFCGGFDRGRFKERFSCAKQKVIPNSYHRSICRSQSGLSKKENTMQAVLECEKRVCVFWLPMIVIQVIEEKNLH